MTQRRERAELMRDDDQILIALERVADRLIAGAQDRDGQGGNGEDGAVPNAYRRLLEEAMALAAEAQAQLLGAQREIDRLRALSRSDEVTGLLNRRGFEEALDGALLRSARHAELGLVALIDLDGFKGINDRHGHAAGDFVLAAVATILKHHIRATDFVARIGGDEFALLLVDTKGAGEPELRLKRLTQALARIAVPWQGQMLDLSASMGIAAYGPDSEPAVILDAADKAMYRGKRLRRVA